MNWVLLRGLAACAAASSSAFALDLTVRDLAVGHWVTVKGSTDAEGRLVADTIKLSDPSDEQEIIGTVLEVREDPDAYAVLIVDGQAAFVGPKAKLRGLQVSDLAGLKGARVGIEGYWRGRDKFSVRELEKRSKGRDRLEGRIDLITGFDGVFELKIMGRSVVTSPETIVESEKELSEFAFAEATLSPDGLNLERVIDDDDDIGGRRFGPNLWAGARLEWQRADERDFDLDRSDSADRVDNEYSVRGEIRWEPSDYLFGLVEYRHAWLDRSDEDDGSSFEDTGGINEAHLYFRDVLTQGLDFQIGRQDFDEEREWLYDENLDAVRMFMRRHGLRYELFAASVLFDGDPREEDARYYGALVSTEPTYNWSVSAYAIRTVSSLDGRQRRNHLGLRGLGEFAERHESWAELSFLTGRESGADLTGWAFDVGDTWYPRWADRWYVTAGWAFGSGDRGTFDGKDSTFRQTGIQDNNGKFGGVTSFRYYGELFRPELANLSIMTLGIGRRFFKRESLDLVFHKYSQDFARPFLVDSDLNADPDGIHRDLGWEVDLIFGSRTFDRANVEVVVGRFDPGGAFPGASPAWTVRLQLRGQL